MICFKIDKLTVEIFPTRLIMGQNAAKDVSEKIKELLLEKDEINMMFAAAPSQNEFLSTLISDKSIPWERINAFHMDEYIGLDKNAPQAFGNFLKQTIFDRVPFKNVYYIDGMATDYQSECNRYARLLTDRIIDIVCLGIGENGHIAFNDPHVADFKDRHVMKVVNLDMDCRQQQVNDGCFNNLEEVPKQAYTLTIPILLSASSMFCVVPGSTKRNAIYNTINMPVDEKYPATILRDKEGAILYIDMESGSLLKLDKHMEKI